MPSFAVDIQNLCKSFDHKYAVDHVNLKIKKGEIFCFFGPNGSGKTTTIRMICGLLKPDSGTGQCLNYDIAQESFKIKKHVGYMTQNFSLYHDLTARENLEFFARIHQLKNARDLIQKTFQDIGFPKKMQTKLTHKLSGGWKQRLSLAAAILHQPQLLLLDEPTSGVDPQSRRDFWDHIHHLSDQGITVLISTHYLDEADHCHRLAYIVQGRLLATGTPKEIIQDSGLVAWRVTGQNLLKLATQLRALKAVEQAMIFGHQLHVIGSHSSKLKKAIQPFQNDHTQWTISTPTLEDVFINLIATTQEKNE